MEASTYCIGLSENGALLQHIYWGSRIASEAASEMAHASGPFIVPFESPTGISREEYVPWGEMRFSEPSLKVKYADGTRTIEWVFEKHGIERSGAGHTLWLRFRDQAYPLTVTLYYRIYDGHDVIERWVQLENSGGSGPVTIEQALSADWRPPRRERYRLTYLYGQHIKEMQVAEIVLGPGKFVLESRRGMTSHQFNPWVALDPEAKATEESGEVWSAALAWSGSWKIVVETTPYGEVHCVGGLNDFDFRYRLAEGEQLDLPAFVGLYSNKGFGGISRGLHTYEREHLLPEALDAVRPVLYNSWEATMFAVNERSQMELAEKAAKLGAEIFVLDDGWFGARDSEYAGLGDWTPQELEEARGFIETYKRMRPIIQNGLLYRLRSPRVGSVAASQYVAQDGSEVVVFAWGHSQQFGQAPLSLLLHGLEEEAYYTDAINGVKYSGAYLTHRGLPMNLVGDFDSCMVHLIRTTSAQ